MYPVCFITYNKLPAALSFLYFLLVLLNEVPLNSIHFESRKTHKNLATFSFLLHIYLPLATEHLPRLFIRGFYLPENPSVASFLDPTASACLDPSGEDRVPVVQKPLMK